MFIRAPRVERVGAGVEVLASVDGEPVVCRAGPSIVTSFHPELSDDLRIHQLFLAGSSAMSGHSKWATIKHKKGAADAKRAKVFAKLIRQVEVAAREGGGDPVNNPTLRTMFAKARESSVPMDTIERAIKRGTGELEGVRYETIMYEGYAPGGVAMLVDCLTDNRNRTGAEVRSIFSKNGGSMAEPGAVGWQFERKGVIIVTSAVSEDELMDLALEAGAEDLTPAGRHLADHLRADRPHRGEGGARRRQRRLRVSRDHDAGPEHRPRRQRGHGQVGPAPLGRPRRPRRRPERLRELRHPRCRLRKRHGLGAAGAAQFSVLAPLSRGFRDSVSTKQPLPADGTLRLGEGAADMHLREQDLARVKAELVEGETIHAVIAAQRIPNQPLQFMTIAPSGFVGVAISNIGRSGSWPGVVLVVAVYALYLYGLVVVRQQASRTLIATSTRIMIYGGRRWRRARLGEYYGDRNRNVRLGTTPRQWMRTDALGEPLYIGPESRYDVVRADDALPTRFANFGIVMPAPRPRHWPPAAFFCNVVADCATRRQRDRRRLRVPRSELRAAVARCKDSAMAQVDAADDSIQRWVVYRYRLDPERRERRNVIVAAFDNEAEFRAYVDAASQVLLEEQRTGLAEPIETLSGRHLIPGHQARRSAKGAVSPGCGPPARTVDLTRPRRAHAGAGSWRRWPRRSRLSPPRTKPGP